MQCICLCVLVYFKLKCVARYDRLQIPCSCLWDLLLTSTHWNCATPMEASFFDYIFFFYEFWIPTSLCMHEIWNNSSQFHGLSFFFSKQDLIAQIVKDLVDVIRYICFMPVYHTFCLGFLTMLFQRIAHIHTHAALQICGHWRLWMLICYYFFPSTLNITVRKVTGW